MAASRASSSKPKGTPRSPTEGLEGPPSNSVVATWNGSGWLSSPKTFQKAAHQPPGWSSWAIFRRASVFFEPMEGSGADPKIKRAVFEVRILKRRNGHLQGRVRIVPSEEVSEASIRQPRRSGDQHRDRAAGGRLSRSPGRSQTSPCRGQDRIASRASDTPCPDRQAVSCGSRPDRVRTLDDRFVW